MNKSVFALFAMIYCLNSFSQKMEKDTLHITFVKSNWAIEYSAGVQAHQLLNQTMFGVPFSFTNSFTIFYKNFKYSSQVSRFEFTSDQADLYIENNNLLIGYNYDINEKWSADLNVGMNMSNIFPVYFDRELRYEYGYTEYENKVGGIVHLGLNRYFKLKRFNFIVASLSMSYYTTKYHQTMPIVGNGSLNYMFTLAYKGWFRKKLKQSSRNKKARN